MTDSSQLLNELRINRGAPAAPEPRARWPWIVLVLVVLLGAAVAFFLLRPTPIAVRTVASQAIDVGGAAAAAASVLDATGYVTARRQATVSAKITGKVSEVFIEEGQRVEAGEILARLEPTDADAQRSLSNAQLAAARSQVAQIEAQLKLAESTLKRNQDLAARKLVATSQLDQAQAERDALAAQLGSTRRNVEVASEALKLSDIGVDNTVVRAPFAGVITVKAAQPGEIVSPMSAGGGFTRTGIGTVVDMDSLEVQVDVNEAFIGRVKPKQTVEAVLNAYPDWKIPAEVIAIVPTADRSKATVKVRIGFREKDPRIVPEMGVRVSFLEDAAPVDAAAPVQPVGVRVPTEAIVTRDGKTVVFVVRDDVAKLREITAEDKPRDGQRRVLRGLGVGEAVVLAPPAELVDGSAVTLGK